MAHILHCDGCHAQDDSVDDPSKDTSGSRTVYMGAPTASHAPLPRIKVTQGTNIFGMKKDLCNRCIAKINTILQIPIDTPAIPEERKTIPPPASAGDNRDY